MLTFKNSLGRCKFKFITFQIFISLFAFQTAVFGEFKKNIADEYREKGYAEQQKGDFVKALTFYNKAISLGNEDPDLLNDLGILCEQIGFSKKSEGYYLRAIQVDPEYLPAYLNLAYLYLQNGQESLAIKYFKHRYEVAEPDDPWAQTAKNELIKINSNFAQWFAAKEAQALNEQVAKRVAQEKQDELAEAIRKSKAYVGRGDRLVKEESYQKAIIEYNRALALTPDVPKILESREKAVLAQAEENIRRQSELAIMMLNSGDMISARREVQKLLTTIPNEPVMNSR